MVLAASDSGIHQGASKEPIEDIIFGLKGLDRVHKVETGEDARFHKN